MTNELDIAFTAANQDPEVRVIVLRGEGKHFSSGHDLGTPEQNADPNWAALSSNGFRGEFEKWSTLDAEYCLRWRSLGKPVIAALKGCACFSKCDCLSPDQAAHCLSASHSPDVIYHACSLASVADIIIAADDLKYMPTMVQCFMLPWDLALNARKVRSIAGTTSTTLIDSRSPTPPQIMLNSMQVKEILLTRRFILAPEAEELGLVNRIVPTGQEDAEALRMAALISNVSDGFQVRCLEEALVWMLTSCARLG